MLNENQPEYSSIPTRTPIPSRARTGFYGPLHLKKRVKQRRCVVDKQSKRVIGSLWMASMVAIGVLLSPVDAFATDTLGDNRAAIDTYELIGELIVNEQVVAKPQDQIQDGSESYIIVQRAESSIRLTYSVQSAGDNLLNARFLIEQDEGEGWEPLMQPSVQAVLGQPSSVSLESPSESDEPTVTFHFTFTSM